MKVIQELTGKFCPKCKRIYAELNKFGKDSTRVDGLQVYCKKCRKDPNWIKLEQYCRG